MISERIRMDEGRGRGVRGEDSLESLESADNERDEEDMGEKIKFRD